MKIFFSSLWIREKNQLEYPVISFVRLLFAPRCFYSFFAVAVDKVVDVAYFLSPDFDRFFGC